MDPPEPSRKIPPWATFQTFEMTCGRVGIGVEDATELKIKKPGHRAAGAD
jgi:hypothetical protein